MTTTYDMIPAEIPSYAINTELARQANDDAVAGISTGFPASIRIKASKFRLVDGNGEETIVKPAELAEGEFLPIVVLAAKRSISKVYYATAYDPNQAEASAPDCFSLDGERPDASIKKPVNPTCATCPMNAFGSGRNQAGQPTKGKACSDNKILAVMYKGGVYQFKIPPASLKNWGVFAKNLSGRGVPLGHAIVYVGFDDSADYSVLTFRVGGFVPESKLGFLAEMAQGQEVKDIIHPTYTPAAQAAAGPSPKALEEAIPAKTPVVDLFGGEKAAQEPAEAAEAPKRATRTKKPAEPAAEAASAVPSDEELSNILGL